MAEETEAPVHVPGTRRGEDIVEDEGKEPGRYSTGTTGDTERPAGTSTARDATGIDPQGTQDPDSPPNG